MQFKFKKSLMVMLGVPIGAVLVAGLVYADLSQNNSMHADVSLESAKLQVASTKPVMTESSAGDESVAGFSKPADSVLRDKLTWMQYRVTQKDGTEPPFENEYWDEKREGIYVDIVSGEPLFSSTDKYRSGTGWPSFTKPIDQAAVTRHEDRSWLGLRIEVRSKLADSHLGHVFKDGPAPTGLRYCINSAALRFIPKTELEQEGYSHLAGLFQ